MKQILLLAVSVLGAAGLGALAMPRPAHAVTRANGVYRAGCVGPSGAAAVKKQ